MNKDGKKRLEIDENIPQEDNIYSNFEKMGEEVPDTKPEDNLYEASADNYEQDNDIKGYQYKEKEYKTGFLEENTQVTKASLASRFILFGFYILLVVIGAVAVFMIRNNKYEFYVKQSEVLVGVGSSYQVELIPKDIRYFDYLKYSYSIADESIATVDEYGTVTTKAPGRTTLKISLKPGFTSKTVQIVSEEVEIDDLDIGVFEYDELKKKNAINLSANQSVTLKAIVNGRTDINATAKFESSDSNIAVVDSFGNVTAKNEGSAVITGELGGIECYISVYVKKDTTPTPEDTKPKETVKPTESPEVTPSTTPSSSPKTTTTPSASTKPSTTPSTTPKPTTSSKVTKINLGIASQTTKYTGEALQLSPSVTPSNATGYKIKWTSSNTSVATVNSNGLIVCNTAGTTVITAEVDGVKASSTIVVKAKTTPSATTQTAPKGTQFSAKEISLNNTSLTVTKGKTATFTVTVTKAAGTVKITSSNASVAKVTLPVGDADMPTCNQSNNTCFFDGLQKGDTITFTVNGVSAGTAYINVETTDLQTLDLKAVTGTGKVGILVK